jgi:hypothetical protein
MSFTDKLITQVISGYIVTAVFLEIIKLILQAKIPLLCGQFQKTVKHLNEIPASQLASS